jgi:hypothetical protein
MVNYCRISYFFRYLVDVSHLRIFKKSATKIAIRMD